MAQVRPTEFVDSHVKGGAAAVAAAALMAVSAGPVHAAAPVAHRATATVSAPASHTTAGTGSEPPCPVAALVRTAAAPILGCGVSSPLGAPSATPATAAAAAPCAVVPGINDACPTWTATFDNPGADSAVSQTSGDDEPRAMRVAGGRLYVTGSSWDGSRRQLFVAAYDTASGAQLWARRWADPAGASDTGWGLAVNPAGSAVFVTGQRCASSLCSIVTQGYDAASGSLLWTTLFHDAASGNDLTCCIAASPDGRQVFVTGGEQPGYAQGDSTASFLTIAYDAGSGTQQWAQTYRGPLRTDGNNLSQARRVAVDPGGHAVYVSGVASAAGAQIDVFTTIAYDPATGSTLWLSTFAHQTVDAASDMTLSADGTTLYAAGLDRYCPVGAGCDTSTDSYATVAYNAATGAQLWSTVVNKVGDAQWLAVAPDRSTVYVTGTGFGATTNNYVATVVAMDGSNGAQRWRTDVQPAGGDGYASGVTALGSPAEAVVIVTSLNSGAAFQTVGLDAVTGATAWQGLANDAPANDVDAPWWVATDAAGMIYVSGLVGQEVDPTTGATNDIDTAILAYRVPTPAPALPEAPAAALLLLVGLLAVAGRGARRRRTCWSSS